MNRPDRRTLWLFAALVLYILAQFIWWAVLLLRRNAEVAHLSDRLRAQAGEPGPVPAGARDMMVVSEAAVFLTILLVLLWLTYRAVRRDLAQAARQRNFILAVTHELRTPIAAAKLQVQTLARPGLAEAQREALLGTAEQELDRLAALTNKVLAAAQAEDGVPLHPERVDVAAIVGGAVRLAERTYGKDHAIRLHGPSAFEARIDPQALRSIVDNLLENAAKYAPAGSVIEARIEGGHHGWRLHVSDEGPGIPLEERERIFERFYRVGQEETREKQGTGLGLYIVQRLLQRCGGSIEVRPRHPQGSIFVASFPHT
jgi:signal transduction histidine kinase